ncbi:MAG: peptidylprolyl isomerase [Armatimonadota bacterium]|nr:peptidylprolyl isomerase [bacterium]
MRKRMLVVIPVTLACLALPNFALAATKSVKPAAKPSVKQAAKPSAKASKPAVFNQQAELDKFWNGPDNAVVGTVNGVAVTKKELMKALWYWNAPTVLSDVLNQKMIEQTAAKDKVSLSNAELQGKISESLKRMNMSNIDQLCNQYKVTKDRFMAGTKVSALAEKVVTQQTKVTDAELSEYIKARHILVRFPQDEKDKAKGEEAAKQKIDEIAAKLKAGEDFSKLADQYSEDPGNDREGKKQGGDLGWFNRGRMVQEFETAAFALKAGEVSEPVKTFYGYHIIKVEKLGRDATPAEKAELKKMVMDRKVPTQMGQWFQELQAKAKVVNNLMAPVVAAPKPAYAPQPGPAPKPKVTAPAPAPRPVAPATSEKPQDTPPPPPPPAPAN